MEIRLLIGSIVTLVGAIFIFLGSLGIVRMPDLYNRLQAGTKASTLGTILSVAGIGIMNPDWAGKAFILIAFVMMTNPVSSHTLARAAHHIGIALSEKTVIDKLKEDNSEENKEEK
ncbi:MAG: cation:proton antiporter [Bacteroidetes bacterium HGW-Bacteroidetes-6]|jgi:multicomponent Na+:H+ antiporter subunit G|nr:MAG: cation:proton antiporter [Bacteroidetes bacterium HGW-Bacteroidetes-6]